MFAAWVPQVLQLAGMGAGLAASPPAPSGEAVGWYGADDGLVEAVSPPRYKDPADARRYWMDFSALAEVRAGDAVVAGAVAASPASISLAGVAVSGPRVEVTVYAGRSPTEYAIEFTATLSSGAVVNRAGTLRVISGV